MRERVEIVRLGHAGDGVTADGRYVRFGAPDDVLDIDVDGEAVRIADIVTPGPGRATPLCRHFGRCGGCALQHIGRDAYLAWKQTLVVDALKARGFQDPVIEPIRAVPPGTRRRAVLKAQKGKTVELGFYEVQSRVLVDLAECRVLAPELERLLPKLKAGLNAFMNGGEKAELHLTQTETGPDLSLTYQRRHSADLLMALAEFAAHLRLARLTWNGELVAQTLPPTLTFGGCEVAIPPGTFLQATREGEAILQSLVLEEAVAGGTVADLFSGCGTFALPLAVKHSVHAVDSLGPQIDALKAAAKRAKGKVTAETRDLFRRPLLPAELSRFSCVVLDPPRPGAQAQAEILAQSQVQRVLYVSCNPASFARDARILCGGGYALKRVVPLDQFLWSPHVELFGVFART